MIDRNGGYAIVDLKGKTLSDTPTPILGTHSAIAKAIAGSKPILLTGLTTGGPCFVQISVDGTSYVISGVYGNDITVTSADAVTSAAVSGGGGAMTFSFAHGGTVVYCLFDPGMTFADFVASDYNSGHVFRVEEGVVIYTPESTDNALRRGESYILGTDDIADMSCYGIASEEYV